MPHPSNEFKKRREPDFESIFGLNSRGSRDHVDITEG
jgi:hypothetical protein